MIDIFMFLLLNLTKIGKLTEANLYATGDFSTVSIKTDSGIYKVLISKEAKQETK